MQKMCTHKQRIHYGDDNGSGSGVRALYRGSELNYHLIIFLNVIKESFIIIFRFHHYVYCAPECI